jgi:hypothetical protein
VQKVLHETLSGLARNKLSPALSGLHNLFALNDTSTKRAVTRHRAVIRHLRAPDPRVWDDFGWQRLESAAVAQRRCWRPGADSTEVIGSAPVTVHEATTSAACVRWRLLKHENTLLTTRWPYQPPSTCKDRRLVLVEHRGSICRRRNSDLRKLARTGRREWTRAAYC